MQRIQQAATRGYCLYTSGVVACDKAQGFADKMAAKYGVDLNENQRSYRRRLKKSNAFLYLYPKKNSDVFLWWLLVTEGVGTVHDQEKLTQISDKQSRLTWDNDYELVLLPKPNSKPTVTWRMTRPCYKQWNQRIRLAIRQRYTDDKVRQALWSLARAPGFSGIREQVKRLYQLFQGEWRRTRKKSEEQPKLPKIFYVRGLKSNTYFLTLIIKRLKSGVAPYPRIDSIKEKNNEV